MPQLKFVRINQSGAGTQTIEAAVADKRHVVVSFSLAATVATALPEFQSAATVIAGPYLKTANPLDIAVAGTKESPLFYTAVNEALELVTAGAGVVTGHVTYYTTEAGI